MSGALRPLRSLIASIREALASDGIRRLELSWTLGIAADAGLLVVLLVVVYERDGVVATGLLGAIRMVPAVLSGMLSGPIIERFRGDRVLFALGLIRAAAAATAGIVIATNAPDALLFVLAAVAAAAGAPVRPTQLTLIPAIARSPSELVAANMTWSAGEGLGSMAGPVLAGALIAAGQPETAAIGAAGLFALTAIAVGGLRFEHAADATGGVGERHGGLRLVDGLRTLARRPVLGWAMLAVYAQVLVRYLLTPMTVVAAIELLGMGDGGVGILNGALGLGGLVGAVFAIGLGQSGRLVPTLAAALAYWGAPIAVIGLLPLPPVAVAAMVVVGIANAVFDVALFTIFQRGSRNEERAPVFSVFEGVAGLGAASGSVLAPAVLAAFGVRGGLAISGAILPVVALLIYGRVARGQRVTVVDEQAIHLLRQVPAFAALPLTAIERLAEDIEPRTFAAGEALMREGEPGDLFLVIESGTVEIRSRGQVLATAGPGTGVGEIALVRQVPRTATATALEPVTAMAIRSGSFLASICGPAAAAAMERMVESRLRRGAVPAEG